MVIEKQIIYKVSTADERNRAVWIIFVGNMSLSYLHTLAFFVLDYCIYIFICVCVCFNTKFITLHAPHCMNKLFPKLTFTRKEGNHIHMKVLIKAYSMNNCW